MFEKSITLCILALFSTTFSAPATDSALGDIKTIDGQYMLQLGKQFNNPLMRVLGLALTSQQKEIHLVKDQLMSTICALNACEEWTAWSECPAKNVMQFGVVTRTRECGKTNQHCTFDTTERRSDTESMLCEGSYSICQANYTKIDGFCLKLFTTPMAQDNAQSTCQVDGGHLIHINSMNKSVATHTLLNNESRQSTKIWINGRREKAGEPWKYTYEKPTNFENWHSGQPNEAGTDVMCIADWDKRKWYDSECSNKYAFICEI